MVTITYDHAVRRRSYELIAEAFDLEPRALAARDRLTPRSTRRRIGGRIAAVTKWVYDFAEGSKDMRELLGGKGANVAEMTRVLGPDRVPAGFTITTEACVEYMRADRTEPDGMADEVAEALARLEEQAGKTLGDRGDPLLVSVRSGARESMPGMLDTVLNLGLNDESVERAGARPPSNERFAWDSYRRFVQMFGNVSRGIPGEKFEDAIKAAKDARGVTRGHRARRRGAHRAHRHVQADLRRGDRRRVPPGPAGAAAAGHPGGVRLLGGRARGLLPAPEPHPGRLGHGGQRPADGVRQQGRHLRLGGGVLAATRSPARPSPAATSCPTPRARTSSPGVRTPRDISEMKEWMPEVHEQLMEILRALEAHYEDMQDTEFTVEEGQLYMLQTRNAKRPAQAAVRFAVDAVSEGLLNRERALLTIDPDSLDALLHPTFDPQARIRGACLRGQRVAGRGQGRDRVHRRRRGGGGAGGARRDPGAPVHRRRGRRRLSRRARDPHLRGRQGIACGAGGARDGPARGGRRPGAGDRPGHQDRHASNGTELHEGDRDRHRRHQGPGHRR